MILAAPVSIFRSYAQSRAQFLAAAQAADTDITALRNGDYRGPDGETLETHMVWLGKADAPNVFLAVSGMHGLEGPAGSAVQSAWLRRVSQAGLPEDTAICLVHALNAWGFAHRARGTENNVDLNRNFLCSFEKPLPANPYYNHIRDVVRVPSLGPEDIARMSAEYERLVETLGPARLSIAVNSGQYEDAEGLAFGGSTEEFGHRLMRDHVLPRLSHARRIAFIDWHTGVGAFGEVAFLPSGKPGTRAYAHCAAMWGARRIEDWRRSTAEAAIAADEALIGESTDRSGQLRHWLARALPTCDVAGAVIEFGTERAGDIDKLVLTTLYERWLRFVDRGARTDPKHAWALGLHSELFIPESPDWQAMVLREGPQLMDQAIGWLAAQH